MTENQSLGRIYTQITETGVTFHNLFMILQQNVMLNNFQHQQCSFEFFPTEEFFMEYYRRNDPLNFIKQGLINTIAIHDLLSGGITKHIR